VKIIEEAKPKLTIIQHFSKKMIDAEPMAEAREIQKRARQQVIAAKDGLIINPVSFSAKGRQTVLREGFY